MCDEFNPEECECEDCEIETEVVESPRFDPLVLVAVGLGFTANVLINAAAACQQISSVLAANLNYRERMAHRTAFIEEAQQEMEVLTNG